MMVKLIFISITVSFFTINVVFCQSVITLIASLPDTSMQNVEQLLSLDRTLNKHER